MTKGNPEQSPASRAQNRLEASSGLDRIRQAARRDRHQRFTNLMHPITVDLLRESYFALKRRMHDPVPAVGKRLASVVDGHCRYYGVPMNLPALWRFRFEVIGRRYRALCRRSQKGRITWDRMKRLAARYLPVARVYHPYPLRRLGVIT